MRNFLARVEDTSLMDEVLDLIKFARSLPFPVTLHRVQYFYHKIQMTRYQEFQARAADPAVKQWLEGFIRLGELLSFRL
jgi:hypothetical protein